MNLLVLGIKWKVTMLTRGLVALLTSEGYAIVQE